MTGYDDVDGGAEGRGPRQRVLLIEDDELDVMAFIRAMEQQGLNVELQRAANAIEAFEVLRLQLEERRSESMMIVLDLNMPAMNGLEFLAELRADPELGNSVVFTFTTSDTEEDVRRAYELNVAGYLVKGIDETSTFQLVDLIGHYLKSVKLPRFGLAQPAC